MGCPYNSKLFYGIKLDKKEKKTIEKEFEILGTDESIKDWEKEVGDFETSVWSDENDKHFFLEISNILDVDCCEYIGKVKDIDKAKIEADKIYDTSPFLKKHFKKDRIELLMACQYCG